jgi:hypothetical protein
MLIRNEWPKLSDLPDQTGIIGDWMPDKFRHDRKAPGSVRHSGEGRNPESSLFKVIRTAQRGGNLHFADCGANS